MPFEELPTTPTADELLDKAFSRAARAGKAKDGTEGQLAMLRTAGNILSDNLQHVAQQWPDFGELHPFHVKIAGTVVDLDDLKQHLSAVTWAGQQCGSLRDEYHDRVRRADPETARRHRKQAFARMADVVEEVAADLEAIGEAGQLLGRLPGIDPEAPTIVVAGYPNVGKTSFVNAVTRARNETASYPFTTTGILVGHFDRDHIRYQLIDTPGLLDRPPSERNDIERQAIEAITHAADCLLVLVDPSETCGYPLEDQLALRDVLVETFEDIPALTVCAKADRSTAVAADVSMSVTESDGLDAVLDAAVEAIDYEPDLPFESDAG